MTAPSVTVRVRDLHVSYEAVTDQGAGVKGLLSRRDRKFRRIHAVRGVTFDLHAGESLGIIGSNGSGKSTLLAALTGLLPIESGEVSVRSRPTLLGVGAVMRPSLSGRRNIAIGGLAIGLSLAEVRAQMDSIIDFAGLRDSIDLPMRTYSSGMRARLMFAIATSSIPEILLIDEALAVGDAEFAQRSQRRIDAIRARAGSVVLVSHNHGEIRSSCDRVLWLEQGSLIQAGDPDDVIGAYEERVRNRIAEQVLVEKPSPSASATPTMSSTAPPPPLAARTAEERVLTFHIGSAHTTLPIQRYLAAHKADLASVGVSVPSFLGLRSHYPFGAAASERAAELLPVDTGPDWRTWRDAFVKSAKSEMDDGNNWIVSSELFASHMGPKGITGLRQLAEELGFSDARAVLYVQRQDRLAAMSYVAGVIAGDRSAFDIDAEVERIARYDWRPLCESWGNPNAFENLIVRLYPLQKEQDVVTDFANALSLPAVDPAPLLGEPTLSAAAVAFVLQLTHPDATDGAKRATIARAARTLATTTATPFTLTRSESDRLVEAYAESNAWILGRVDESARIEGYFDLDPSLLEVRTSLGLEDAVRFAGRLARQPIG